MVVKQNMASGHIKVKKGTCNVFYITTTESANYGPLTFFFCTLYNDKHCSHRSPQRILLNIKKWTVRSTHFY